jgi:hypothetical protein
MPTTTWTNALMDNDGNNAGNWDNGLPDSTTDAVLIDSTSSDGMALSDALDCKTLTCTGYTGTISGAFDLTVSGNITLGAGMTFSNEQLRMDADGILTTNGVPLVGFKVLGAHTLTLGGDTDISTVENLFDTLAGSTLAFGANDLILRNSGINLSFVGLAVTFSAGAHILLQGNEWTSDAVATWPPLIDAAESGPGNLYDWKFESITLAKSASFNDDLIVVGDMTINAAPGITFAYGSVVTVGGNFSADTTELASNGQAGTRPTIDVTGTAVATDTIITFLDFSGGTELDATDGCTDGGGNDGIDFGVPANEAPIADAGPDDTVSFPGPYTLQGSATDADMDELTYLWEKVSGPGTATFVDDTDPETDVSFSEEGAYVLRLTADDGTDSDSDETTITVSNEGPSADAGKDQSITIPQTGNLDATGSTDDGAPVDPGALTYLWEYVSGPADGYQIADEELAHTSASFSRAGTYVFKVTVDDGDVTDTDTVTISVTQHCTGPGSSGPFQQEPPRGNINSSFFKTKGK